MFTWQTASELDNRGFNLYRGVSPDGWDRRLNDALIPSQSQGSPAGFFYTWTDQADLTPGTTYYYWLQDMDLSGALTMHGPVSVDFTMPTAVTLSDVLIKARSQRHGTFLIANEIQFRPDARMPHWLSLPRLS